MERVCPEYELDLQKITESGQCFRPVRLESGLYRFISGRHLLYCRPLPGNELELSCSREEWERVWLRYFDLNRNYGELCGAAEETPFLKAAAEYGRGIRILRQDRWEMLVSFILSQRKSIPAIRSAIRRLCESCGEAVSSPYEEAVFLFPTPEALLEAGTEGLLSCGLGYRAPYVRDAAEKVLCGELSLDAAESLCDEELMELLCSVRGVGKKVASCVMLFAYGRYEIAPSDVWIQRVVEKKYAGREPFSSWRGAGILQQYLFYYALKHKEEFAP